jgi:hypothetical protein
VYDWWFFCYFTIDLLKGMALSASPAKYPLNSTSVLTPKSLIVLPPKSSARASFFQVAAKFSEHITIEESGTLSWKRLAHHH